jgi:glycosyltransferase involved in cell wall biosynthesis
VLHAPNHRSIKGTAIVEEVVRRLRADGVPVELVIVQKMPNHELRRLVQEIDVVVEQLVIGWYGIFALEAMACAKPVLTYIAPELERLYRLQGLLDRDELPVTKVDHNTLEAALRAMAMGERDLAELGRRSRAYVLRRHSLEVVGAVFAGINRQLGLRAPQPAAAASAEPPPRSP